MPIFSLLETSLSIFMDGLRDANQNEIPTPQALSEEEKSALANVIEQLPEVLRETKQLKQSLQEGGHIKSRGRGRRKEGELPGEKMPKMRDENYLDEVAEFKDAEKFNFSDFVLRICGSEPYPFPLDHAWKCAMAGFESALSLKAVQKIVHPYIDFDDPDTMLSLVKDATSVSTNARENGLGSAYAIVKDDKAFTARGTHPWLQHMCAAAVYLHFGLSWKSLGSGEEGNSRKRKAREKLFKPTRDMTEEEKASPEYVTWMNRFDVKRTACTRMLEAYELLGSIVMLHLGFAYATFKDSRHCPAIGHLLEDLRARIDEEGNSASIVMNELVNRRLVQRVVESLCAKDSLGKIPLLELFEVIEAGVDRRFIGDLPEK